ncbi:unnamed protein product, partial [Didymodactylos carnosus]
MAMKSIDIIHLQQNIGCLISFNSYLSTTRDEEVAKIYAGIGPTFDSEMLSVIIEIITVPNVMRTVFADISELSEFKDEQEILFDIGSVFLVSNVEYIDGDDNDERYWYIKLLTNDKKTDYTYMCV